jgi:hypothetical protein
MSLLRPLDPSFPIERQVAIDTGPVVLVNLFTVGKADEQTSSSCRRQSDLFELCSLGDDCPLQGGVYAS